MGGFFTRERFGRPQFLAGLLLLVLVAECLWMGAHGPATESRLPFQVAEGLRQWRGIGIAGAGYVSPGGDLTEQDETVWSFTRDGYDPNHSPLWYLIASAPVVFWPAPSQEDSGRYWKWLALAPCLTFAVLLGASLWYVARRLYGNAGGFIALTLYCFSPQVIRSALSSPVPEMGAAWGTFGTVFTAIAVTHTLYAPREVVLWNWRRILLLGLSLALAVGSQFSLWILVPVALAFMLYLAPERRGAALAIWGAACLLAAFLLSASYFFRPAALWLGLSHASFMGILGRAYAMPGTYWETLAQVTRCGPALTIAAPVALLVYCVWRRTRYFGNTAPLLVAALLLILALGMPHYPGLGFHLMAVPFLFVFVAGVLADLIETPQRSLVIACVWGLLSANAIWNLWELARFAGSR